MTGQLMYKCILRKNRIYGGRHTLYCGSGSRERIWIEYHPDKPDILHVRVHYTDSYAVFDAEHAEIKYTAFWIDRDAKVIRAFRSIHIDGMRVGANLESIDFYGKDEDEFIAPGYPSFDDQYTLTQNDQVEDIGSNVGSLFARLPVLLGLPNGWSIDPIPVFIKECQAIQEVYANRFYCMIFGDYFLGNTATMIQRKWRSFIFRRMAALP